jgi:chemotaxis signal transduction protein
MPSAVMVKPEPGAAAAGGSPQKQQQGSERMQTPSEIRERAETSASAADKRVGKYLTFLLGREEFAIRVLKVREIMGIQDITAVPRRRGMSKG